MFMSVAEDIEHLRHWWKADPDDATIRRGSAILRRLLVERVLLKAWRECGFQDQPIIIGPDLVSQLNEIDLSKVIVSIAGGGKIKDVRCANMTLVLGADISSPEQYPGQTREELIEKKWRLLDYLEATSIFIGGETVNRREIIKYFANVLGGVHLSSKVRRREEDLIRRLSKMRDIIIDIAGTDHMHFELLSIGQAIGQSEDLSKLSQTIRSRMGRG